MKYICSLWAFILVTTVQVTAQPGANDPTFNLPDTVGPGLVPTNHVLASALQPDGKIIIAGFFGGRVARISANGQIDTDFDPGTGFDQVIRAVALQPDGKIIVAGDFTSFNGVTRNRIARLNADGSLDNTFDPLNGVSASVRAVAVQADGKIIIGGFFTSVNGIPLNRIARLNADGSVDASFNIGTGANNAVTNIAIQADGRIVIAGTFLSYNGTAMPYVACLQTDGSLDNSFTIITPGTSGRVDALKVQNDGMILIGGSFTASNGAARIIRVHPNGSLDPGFNLASAFLDVQTIAVQANGKILVGGSLHLTRFNADGSVDNSFHIGQPNQSVLTIQPLSDETIVACGNFTSYNQWNLPRVVHLFPDGTIHPHFPSTGASDRVSTIAIQSDGKILIGGSFTGFNRTAVGRFARLLPDGNLDSSFNSGTGANGHVRAIAIQNDGKIIIAGEFSSYDGVSRIRIARLHSDGSLDVSFDPGTGTNSPIYAVAIQNDGKIIIGGDFGTYNGITTSRIARLETDGSLDNTFSIGAGIGSNVQCLAIQSDGKIIAAGPFSWIDGHQRNGIVRLNPNGSIDFSFSPPHASLSPPSGTIYQVYTLALQDDGKYIIGGGFFSNGQSFTTGTVRLNANGTLDNTFNAPVTPSNIVHAAILQSDGKIIIGGQFTNYAGTGMNRLVRLNPNGSIDPSFNSGLGPNGTVSRIVQVNGKLFVAGEFTQYNGAIRNRIARIENNAPLPVTFLRITGENTDNGVRLNWEVTNEKGVAFYLVERSASGAAFVAVSGEINAGNMGDASYTWLDNRPHQSHNFYRIKSIDKDGQVLYSNIIKVVRLNDRGTITIAPNPIINSEVNLQFSNQDKGKYTVKLFNNIGQPMQQFIINHDGGSSVNKIFLNGMGKGMYQVVIIRPDGTIITHKLMAL